VGTARYIDHLEAVDDHTVKFFFKQPYAAFLAIHPMLVTSKAYFDRVGEAEFIMSTPYNDVEALEKAGFKTARLVSQPTTSIQFHLKNPNVPWHDIRVRQAIAYAIDTQAIVKGLLHGIPVHYPRLLPGETGYDPNLKNYEYNPAKAKQLL